MFRGMGFRHADTGETGSGDDHASGTAHKQGSP
jgi:hypothetical protein